MNELNITVCLGDAFNQIAANNGSGDPVFAPLREALSTMGAKFVTGEEFYNTKAQQIAREQKGARSLSESTCIAFASWLSQRKAKKCQQGRLRDNFIVVSADRKDKLIVELASNPVLAKFITKFTADPA